MNSSKSPHEVLLNAGACWGRVLRKGFQTSVLKNKEKLTQKEGRKMGVEVDIITENGAKLQPH